ncbi:TetR/AcrR family transcriptional regulator [Plantactinospora sp. GCM10030261]|uniref:TetR/AcrR family transcriptional regulator n=1 Tax=Plantactinospora sp. GCM10030261 TaxID=3273420 RepID=UPI00361FCF45
MTPRTAAEMAPQRRRQLIETAAREFANAGYEQASLNRIIRVCSMSKSSFYYYVSAKQELFDLVVEELAAALARDLDPPAPAEFASGDFWARVGDVLDRLAEIAGRDPAALLLGRMFHLPGAPTGADSALGRAWGAVQGWLDQTLAVGRSVGAVRDDLPASLQGRATMALLRTFDEWSLAHLAELSPVDALRLGRAQLDGLRRFLAPDRESPGVGNLTGRHR